MQRPTLPLRLLLPILAMSGCALQHVEPAPLQPDTSHTAYRQRTLGDAATRELLAQRNIDVSAWPPARWSPELLVLASLDRHPLTAQARARAARPGRTADRRPEAAHVAVAGTGAQQ